MTDFFEKLKKGMDIKPEGLPAEPKSEEPEGQPMADLVMAPALEPKQEAELERKRKKKAVKRKSALVPLSGTTAGGPASAKATADEGKIKVEKTPLNKKKKKAIAVESLDLENDDWLNKEKIGQLTVDLYQTDKEIIIQSAIAGVEPEDLDITIEDDLVIIKGKREKKFKEEKENYFYQECHWGRFYREIILPVEADSSRAAASMEQGILTIKIPKTGTETKKKIKITN